MRVSVPEESVQRTILAIDPGPFESAYVIWDGEKVQGFGKLLNNELLNLFDAWNDTPGWELWLEMIRGYGMPAGKEMFETCVWIGRYMQAWNGPLARVERKKVVRQLCGSDRAKDANVRAALIDALGAPGTKKDPGVTYGITKDVWSALAIAYAVTDAGWTCEVEG